jgi:heme oxygenase
VRVIDRLQAETEGFHPDADDDILCLLGAVVPDDYKRFLTRTYGFVQPLEHAIARTPDLVMHADLRRFHKHQLLQRDLEGFRMRSEDIERSPRCSIPRFDSAEQALGWAYVIERSTLSHGNLFRHLASAMPGDMIYTSSYLKCYSGAVGENWREFADTLDAIATRPDSIRWLIDGAKAAFHVHRAWHDESPLGRDVVREQRPA